MEEFTAILVQEGILRCTCRVERVPMENCSEDLGWARVVVRRLSAMLGFESTDGAYGASVNEVRALHNI